MHSNTTAFNLAAFGLGYSLTTIKDRIETKASLPDKRMILNKSVEQLKTFQQTYSFLFSEGLIIPYEYSSDTQMIEFFYSLFEIAETKIAGHCDKNLQIYFFAGCLIYLSDSTEIVFDKKKFKIIFYELLTDLGVNITWNEITFLTTQLYCSELNSKRAAKKQILDYMFAINETSGKNFSSFYPDKIYYEISA